MEERFKILRLLFGFIAMVMLGQIVQTPIHSFLFAENYSAQSEFSSFSYSPTDSENQKQDSRFPLFAEDFLDSEDEEDPDDLSDKTNTHFYSSFSEQIALKKLHSSIASQKDASNGLGLFLVYCSLKIAPTA